MPDRQSADVVTKIRNVAVQKLDEKSNHNTPVIFDFGANIEEADRSNESVTLNFKMTMDTEPAIVKFVIEGTATISGEESEIDSIQSDSRDNNPKKEWERTCKNHDRCDCSKVKSEKFCHRRAPF